MATKHETGAIVKGGPPPTSMTSHRPLETKDGVTNDDRDERRAQKRDCFKRAAKFTFSQLGLCAVVCVYAVAGAFIFQHLEKTNEKQECVQGLNLYEPMENETVYKVWTIATNYRMADDAPYALAAFHKQLAMFRADVLSLGYDGTNCTAMDLPDGPGYKWSFSGALLFSTTVFTTVGYGNIAPKTFWGRLVCIAYAVLGIPLMLLCLSNIGEIMADVFRYTYINVCCFGFWAKNKNRTETTPGQSEADNWKDQYNSQKVKGQPMVVDDEEEEDEMQKVSVPLTVTLLLIGSYLFVGALLFGVWDDWDWLTGAYFCFITIATIGFGDVVPGTSSFNSVAGQLEMIGTAAYMVLGMAILSMAFSLIQEEIVTKFRWLGEKLGIIKKDDEEEDEIVGGHPDLLGRQGAAPPLNRIPQQLGTGNRATAPGRVAALPPNMYPQQGTIPSGPGYFPQSQRKQPPAYTGGMPGMSRPPASLGPNAMFEPPPPPRAAGPVAYRP